MCDYSACAPGKPVGRHPVRHGSLRWQIPQQVLSRGDVIVPRGGVDLPLAEFRQRLRLAPLRIPRISATQSTGMLGSWPRYVMSRGAAPVSPTSVINIMSDVAHA